MAYANSEAEVAEFEYALWLSTLESRNAQPSKSPREQSIPEIESIMLQKSKHLTLLSAPGADTFVFIAEPAPLPGQSNEAYTQIARHFANFHKIQSKNLLTLGSGKFNELLAPSSQYRTERCLRSQGILLGEKPGVIKYLLDLRLPSEGEDALVLVAELSCSPGILEWFKAQRKYGIPRTMVCGQDDSSLLSDPQVLQIPPDYSRLRHWSAIERLLHAIEGKDPMLDSAPKWWTFYAIANYFGCANHERINRWILRWLFAAPNNNFIQCNPEVCYRVALGTQSEILIKETFSLLVGEKALLNVHRENPRVKNLNLQVSVAGRKLGLLDDDELNRIDHAANVFIQRIQSTYDALTGKDMLWLERSRVFRVLSRFVAHSRDEGETVERLIEHVKNFVRSRVLWVLARDHRGDPPGFEKDPESVRPFYPHASTQFSMYNRLSKEERIFTRFFWMMLGQEELSIGDNSVHNYPLQGVRGRSRHDIASSSDPGWSTLARQPQGNACGEQLLMIEKNTLHSHAAEFTSILDRRYTHVTPEVICKWSDNNPHLVEKSAKTLVIEGCSKMLPGKAARKDSLGYAQPAENPRQLHLGNMQRSSPKRPCAKETVNISTDTKRFRMDVMATAVDKDQSNGRKADLPLRAAGCPNGKKASLQEIKTAKMIELHTVNNTPALGTRSASVDTGVPIDNQTEVFTCEINAGQSLLGEPFQSGKEEERELLALGGRPSFSIDELLTDVTHTMHGFCDELLIAAHFFRDVEVPPTDLIDSLMCLTDKEWRCLPLWAGGNDDGSGGAFIDVDVPTLEAGGFAADELRPKGVSALSDWSEVVSTVGKASREATDGTVSETVPVPSLDDGDMDGRSLVDDLSAGPTETELYLDALLETNNLGCDSEHEKDQDNRNGEDDGVALSDAEWDDCCL